jgi:hypothetical protein
MLVWSESEAVSSRLFLPSGRGLVHCEQFWR